MGLINIGTAADDGTGSKPREAALLINRSMNAPLRKAVSVMFDGDSKGVEGFNVYVYVAAVTGISFVRRDTGNAGGYGIGGSDSSSTTNNLTNTTRMANCLAALQALTNAGETVDVSLRMFTNDVATDPATVISRLTTYHNTVVRAGGARFLILFACEPGNGSSTSGLNAQRIALNRRLSAYANTNSHDTIYIDYTNQIIDPNASNTLGKCYPYTATGTGAPIGSVLRDGTHHSNNGDFLASKGAIEALKAIYPKKQTRSLSQVATGQDTNGASGYGDSHDGNLYTVGRTVAIGGVIGGFTGTTPVGTPPASMSLSGTLDGTGAITFTAATASVTADGLPIPPGDWPAVNVALTGTPTTTATFTITYNGAGVSLATNNQIAIGDPLRMFVVLKANNLVGVAQFKVTMNGEAVSGQSLPTLGGTSGANSPLADGWINRNGSGGLDGPIIIEGDVFTAAAAHSTVKIALITQVMANVPLSGSFDILLIGVERAY